MLKNGEVNQMLKLGDKLKVGLNQMLKSRSIYIYSPHPKYIYWEWGENQIGDSSKVKSEVRVNQVLSF